METVSRKTCTKLLPPDADIADNLAYYFGLERVKKHKSR